jgi:hypothetical protein
MPDNITYDCNTPEATLQHLRTFWQRSDFDWRVRFAFFPVDLWTTGKDGFVRPSGEQVWLKRVVEVKTWVGWTAYKRFQSALTALDKEAS